MLRASSLGCISRSARTMNPNCRAPAPRNSVTCSKGGSGRGGGFYSTGGACCPAAGQGSAESDRCTRLACPGTQESGRPLIGRERKGRCYVSGHLLPSTGTAGGRVGYTAAHLLPAPPLTPCQALCLLLKLHTSTQYGHPPG